MGVLPSHQILKSKLLPCLTHGSLVCLFLQHEPERGAQAVLQECRSSHQGRAELLPAAASISEADEEGRHLAC